MVNSGNVLVDNLYLKLSRTLFMPTFTFILQGARHGEEEWHRVGESAVFATNVTFHAEDRGSAQAVKSHYAFCAAYFDGAATSTIACNAT